MAERISRPQEPLEAVVAAILVEIAGDGVDFEVAASILDDARASAVVVILVASGAIELNNGRSGYVIASQVARVYILSLAEHVKSGQATFGGWSRAIPEGDSRGDLVNGPLVTLNLERRRADWPDAVAISETRVVQGLVKAKMRLRYGDRFLVRWDERARAFQFVGGHVRTSDLSAEVAMRREIEEEIPGFGCDFSLVSVLSAHARQVSRTTSAYTQYDMTFYAVMFGSAPPRLSQSDRWVTQGELLRRKTLGGEVINVEGASRGSGDFSRFLERLPYSFPSALLPTGRMIARWAYGGLLALGAVASIFAAVKWIVDFFP